jgi:hypothetical protein
MYGRCREFGHCDAVVCNLRYIVIVNLKKIWLNNVGIFLNARQRSDSQK